MLQTICHVVEECLPLHLGDGLQCLAFLDIDAIIMEPGHRALLSAYEGRRIEAIIGWLALKVAVLSHTCARLATLTHIWPYQLGDSLKGLNILFESGTTQSGQASVKGHE